MSIFKEIAEAFRLKTSMEIKVEQGITGLDLYYIMVGEVDNADLEEGTKENILKDIRNELGVELPEEDS